MKKILIYNWARLDDTNASGGVGVYTRNLISFLLKNSNYEIYFLNSGYSYTLNQKLSLKQSKNIFGSRVKSFEIINSPVLAPVQQSIKNFYSYLNDNSVYSLVKKWLISINGVDVIHFQNIEGLPLSIFNLKQDFPNTKFIYSLHNYFPLCPAVWLWNKNHNCNKKSFDDCATCYRRRCYISTRFARALSNSNFAEGINYYLFQNKPSYTDAKIFQQFVEENKKVLNKNIDSMLAVSERVRNIFISHGYDENKIKTSYIGTKVAESPLNHCNCDSAKDPFNVIFMGYMNEQKGFNFFIKSLSELPQEISKKIHLTICAKHSNFSNRKQLKELRKLNNKFFQIDLINGYSPSNQKQILQGQHLGIVPVLWEDNLPQVLIEQIAYGVPVLCSDLGGGKEIVNNPSFTFRAGDVVDFNTKLINIYNNRSLLEKFWDYARKLTTMQEHVQKIKFIYEQP